MVRITWRQLTLGKLRNNFGASPAYPVALSISATLCHSPSFSFLPLSLPSFFLLFLAPRILFQAVSPGPGSLAATIVIFHGELEREHVGIPGLLAPTNGTTSTGIGNTERPNVWASRCRQKTATPFIPNAAEVCSTYFPR